MATSGSKEFATFFDPALERAKKRSTYHSFGHEGVTATVGASGRLMQMSQHFPNQRVGFCVDNRFVPEPYFVLDRAERLHSWAADPFLRTAIDPILFPSSSWDEPKFFRYVLNRWPVFTRARKDKLEVTIQYVASDATIYQIFDFCHRAHPRKTHPPTLLLKGGLKIRNLDFIDPRNRYNEADEKDKEYKSELKQGRFIREHQINSTGEDVADPNDRKSVVLSISCFEDRKVLQFVKCDTPNYDYYTIEWNEPALKKFEETGKLKAILAYKLDFVLQGNLPPSVSIENLAAVETQLDSAGYLGNALTGDTYLDPILSRNLEHILSVCSIPVTWKITGESAIALTCGDIDGHRVAAAASFYCFQFLLLAWKHFDSRMPPKGSSGPELPYIGTMRDRIEKVCKGHLIWLFERKQKPSNLLSPHQWVNGEAIEDWEEDGYLPPKTLVGAPFQIIKAGDFYETLKDIDPSVKAGVRSAIVEWIRDINQRNKMGLYAFPSYKKEETLNFYFTDHVLIWRAARSAERLGLKEELTLRTETRSNKVSQKQHQLEGQTSNSQSGQKYGKPKVYVADEIQSNILKRFTTENPVSKKRMIAVSRSPAQTRFLLRTKDASLFHAMSLGLFNKPGTNSGFDNWQNIIDVWKNTIDCQIAHEDDDDVWDEPLRFALATVMAYHDKAINHRPAKDMGDHALAVLLQSTSANGLFPGRLDENNEPALYDNEIMRDTYWGVTFEVPYLLWKFFRSEKGKPSIGSDRITEKTGVGGQQPALYDNEIMRDTYWGATFQVPYLLWKFFRSEKGTPSIGSDRITEKTGVGGQQPATLGTNTYIPPAVSAEQAAVKITANLRGNSMKRAFPFNNMVDQDNIVNLTDEWLYEEPAFFVSSQKAVPDDNAGVDKGILTHNDHDVHGDTKSRLHATVSDHAVTEEDFDPDTALKTSLDLEIAFDISDMFQYRYEETLNQSSQREDTIIVPPSPTEFLGAMVDVPKSDRLKKKARSVRESIRKVTTHKCIKKEMENGRTPEKAKKRFWGFFTKSPLEYEICCATSALYYTTSNYDQEEHEMLQDKDLETFYWRHAAYDKFFTDDPAPISNSWTTEFHVSFYGVDKTLFSSSKESTMKTLKRGPLFLPGLEEGDFTQLSSVSMSFRFDGDFFDRYWTCWFFEADPGTKTTEDTIEDDVTALLEGELKEKKIVGLKEQSWQQRRILELLLFDKIISQMHSYSNEILERARSSIRKKTKNPGKTSQKAREEADELDYDEFVKQRERFRQFQEALQAVQDDLNENLNKVDLWLDREKDRQAERPRWTFNDESRYRSIISKLFVCNDHNIQELRRSHIKIKSLNELLTKKVETMRNDVEQRRADDIQRFTYVTVVFLPLGFATGIFSMSEAPASRTLVYMILAAIGALLTICILLENMKGVEDIYKFVSRRVPEIIFTLMRQGLNFVTNKDDRLAEAWQAWMEVICHCCKGRVRRPDTEEGTPEDGIPAAGHDGSDLDSFS